MKSWDSKKSFSLKIIKTFNQIFGNLVEHCLEKYVEKNILIEIVFSRGIFGSLSSKTPVS